MDDVGITRFLVSALVFALIAIWEVGSPRRKLGYAKSLRWFSNLWLIVIDAVAIRIIFPLTAVGAALWCQQNAWGLLNFLDVSPIFAVVASVILLDFVIYLQHVILHVVSPLWKVHRMHHADLDFDVTTGLRFHPIEMLLSMGIKFLTIAIIGAPPLGVLIFEILLNATSMFNHGNIRLPKKFDKIVRWLIVTPDMHRVHHSIYPHETNSNFGFNLPWWDRLLGTYIDQPTESHESMPIGIDPFRETKYLRLRWLLVMPFLRTK